MKKISCIFICLLLSACGDGAIKRMTTVAGIYAVNHPDGFPVVCFVEASHGGVFCVSDADMKAVK